MKLFFYDNESNRERSIQIKNDEREFWMKVLENYNDWHEEYNGIRPLIYTRQEEIFIGRNR